MVSLWLFEAPDEDWFWRTMEVTFSEDGDFLGSEFSRAFDVGYFDAGLREARWLPKPVYELSDLLAGVSYEETVVARFAAIVGKFRANAFVLLYDLKHEGVSRWRSGETMATFVGSVGYM